ncbi:hypothetical protein [Rhodanobacter lindaniclasticus]|uniref:Uncharacterized protein n=1 Tax=Rhodanobacter lindaniclasticus TaxID=75310 RepID=A0A4S3KDD1_9GAMM|nr:hypothetical protein [Rhodanobacter lindaniclasticus]THD06466.1 hypothetical protein B1991_12915 [Rhodanobacter lindaniclasticus]
MNVDACGPVTPAEVLAVVQELEGLSARAAEHGQQMFHFVLSMGAESLADNLQVAGDLEHDE